MNNKIIRSICFFSDDPSPETIRKLDDVAKILLKKNFIIQTKRICSPKIEPIIKLDAKITKENFFFGIGSLSKEQLYKNLNRLLYSHDISFNLDLSKKDISPIDVEILFKIIKFNPSKTFNFAYVFNNPSSSPYFPSANYQRNGFSTGLQPTDLSENCSTLSDWLSKIRQVWREIVNIFNKDKEFLGIDSSIAPLFSGKSSFIGFIKKLGLDFSHSATTDIYLKITNFLKNENPKPVGLGGIMFPCLEDFELANEYENGNFSIERNIYLSLHSGLGVDTYPIGINEKQEKVLEILKLLQGLSEKYNKPLSARFVSDGKAKIGEKTDFRNQYLKDVVIRAL